MKKVSRFRSLRAVLFAVLLLTAGLSVSQTTQSVQAAAKGFYTKGTKTYYRKADGTNHKGWLKLNGQKYFFDRKTGVQLKGWQYDKSGKKLRFLAKSSGVMRTGFVRNSAGRYRYFDPKTGKLQRGWLTIGKKTYYFSKGEGYRAAGWVKNSKGKKRYFSKATGVMYVGWDTNKKSVTRYFGSNGIMYTGLKQVGDSSYYFNPKTGAAYKNGFQTIGGKRYYFDKDGRMQTGWVTIGKKTYYFDWNGVLKKTNEKLAIASDYGILVDLTTNRVLYEKNADLQHANASTTKIMTCILALENCELTDIVTASKYAASQEPTKLYLHAGEQFVLKDLLYSLMIPSHNDTAVAIAEHVSGSTEKFVALMNKKAAQLGCRNTHFATPNGLDQNLTHYTSAEDLVKITRYALRNKTFRKIVGTTSYKIKSKQGNSYSFTTTNELFGKLPGLFGIKTGFTNKAGFCFVGGIKGENGHEYISVVLGGLTSQQRWEDSFALLDYAYKLK